MQYLANAKPKGAAIPSGLQELLLAVVNTCTALSDEVAQGALIGLLGSAGSGNVQGDIIQNCDHLIPQRKAPGDAAQLDQRHPSPQIRADRRANGCFWPPLPRP